MKQITRLNLILILALGLRLISLNQSLWLDEAFQVWSVTHYSPKGLLTEYLTGDFNPPLSYLISWLLTRILGDKEVILRLPSVFLGVVNVWLIYIFSQTLFSKAKIEVAQKQFSLGEIAAFFLALAPLHLYYSQESRPYILASVLATWSMLEFWRLLKEEKGAVWRYVLATALMIYSHYLTWLLLLLQAVFLIAVNGKKIKILQKVMISWLAVFVCFLPWLPIFLKQLRIGSEVAKTLPVWRTLGEISLKNIALVPVKFIIGRIAIENNLLYGFVMMPLILLIAGILLIVFKRTLVSKSTAFYYLWLWFVGPLLLGLALSLKWPMFQYFRFLFILPAFYLLITLGISNLKLSWQGPVVLGIFLINAIASSIYLFNPAFHREDWRSTSTYIQLKDMGAVVVILKPIEAPFAYYNQNQSRTLDYSEINQARFEKRLWLIKYAQPIFEPANNTEETIKQYGFQEVSEKQFRGDISIKYFINPSGLTAFKK
ncbi:hypothetical protein A2160_02365 [Candidatus Beckwithbacteria bacterium RBG_13_42_9]|uniref:Glycosyltransferase RgtA/B/C/D-like domain-containing protein n=1 Tax=Candidatus Beckwithbacteria bacterium RBG_13_42_9 TaxID=1797457 RepID=A0A1F5E7F9_9BACT|nr:MAG: hypothetical protein A2160_02365 [Candidatus Beckwithbacteria bacterium RBG_13_42_9]